MNDPRKRPGFPLPSSLLGSHEGNQHKRRHSQSSEGSTISQEFSAKRITCRLCNNRSFKTEDDFDLHLTLIHYRDQLSERLGMPPYSCGLCNFMPTASDDPNEEMILHYGCKERLALKFYDEEVRKLPVSPSKVAKKPKVETTSGKETATTPGKVKEIDMFKSTPKITCKTYLYLII